MRSILLSGGTRLLGLVPQGIATLLASRLILTHYGLDAFNAYALVIAMMALIPLNNLGMGASVTQAVAAHGGRDDRAVRAALTASRVLGGTAIVFGVVVVLVGWAGWWPGLLGDAAGSNGLTVVAMIVFAVTFIPGLAASVLLGADRNHMSLLVVSFLAPVSLVFVVVMVLADLDAGLAMVIPPLALLVINLITMFVSSRVVGFPWMTVLRRLPSPNRFPGARIRSLSGPMLITSLCVPIMFCTDRIVLSHVSTAEEVADYSVMLQLCAPVVALIAAAAQPLWPMITQARLKGERGPQMAKVFVAFALGTALCGAAMVALAKPIGHLIGGDSIDLGYFLPFTAALAMVLLAIAYPLSMTMVDPKGARFVAGCALLTLPTNIVVSIVLSKAMGAPGPLVSLLIVSTSIQVVPILLYSRRRERSGEVIEVLDTREVVRPGRHRA